ncbi:MAG: hypothetical protein AAGF11_35510 [Myxococcota bacterium]
MLWLCRHPEASTGEWAAALGLLLEFIAETWGPDAVRPFLTYLLSAFPTRTPIRAIIEKSLNPETRHLYTTIRDELIAEGMLKGENKGRADGWADGLAKGRADGLADGRVEGRVEGMAKMLEQLLDSRELELTDEMRGRIAGCKDESLLQRWFQRAITAKTLSEVFDD